MQSLKSTNIKHCIQCLFTNISIACYFNGCLTFKSQRRKIIHSVYFSAEAKPCNHVHIIHSRSEHLKLDGRKKLNKQNTRRQKPWRETRLHSGIWGVSKTCWHKLWCQVHHIVCSDCKTLLQHYDSSSAAASCWWTTFVKIIFWNIHLAILKLVSLQVWTNI